MVAPISWSRNACHSVNHPVVLTSKTRSNSPGSFSGRLRLISRPAAWSSTSTRPLVCVIRSPTAATAAGSVRSTQW